MTTQQEYQAQLLELAKQYMQTGVTVTSQLKEERSSGGVVESVGMGITVHPMLAYNKHHSRQFTVAALDIWGYPYLDDMFNGISLLVKSNSDGIEINFGMPLFFDLFLRTYCQTFGENPTIIKNPPNAVAGGIKEDLGEVVRIAYETVKSATDPVRLM